MENLVPNFQNLVIKEKIFTIFQPQNYLQIFAILTYFIFWSSKIFLPTLQKKIHIKIENFSVFELQPYKKIDSIENWLCVKIPVFPLFFFLFFSIFLKTVGKCLLFISIMHQEYSLFHWKPPPKFEIEALFRLVMLYTDTKTKKIKTYIIVKSIHSLLRLESKRFFQYIFYHTFKNLNSCLIANTHSGLKWSDKHILPPLYILAVLPSSSGNAISGAVEGNTKPIIISCFIILNILEVLKIKKQILCGHKSTSRGPAFVFSRGIDDRAFLVFSMILKQSYVH
ncbi:hypothetical protein AGLY_004354 [Aphis glycines]|uniref:Uncharacterized protein n=1 Tax=Aphis glycines TaxID=307491 RepID=A0A6G0TXT7_APHGL|nr:hypothetical protein AGLY_004354 [Aphis glycines]